MSCWSKEQLEQMLEDVVNELDLSDAALEEHGPMGTPPAQLVRLVLDQKDKTIQMLKAGMIDLNGQNDPQLNVVESIGHRALLDAAGEGEP